MIPTAVAAVLLALFPIITVADKQINVAGGSNVIASSTADFDLCAAGCEPFHVVDVDMDPDGETHWVSKPKNGSCADNEYITVNWMKSQNGPVPISAISIRYGVNPPAKTRVYVYGTSEYATEITSDADLEPPVADADGFITYELSEPVQAGKVKFVFSDLHRSTKDVYGDEGWLKKNNGSFVVRGLCFVDVDEIKAFAKIGVITRISALSPAAAGTVVIAIIFFVAGGVLLYLRQRELAIQMGVRIPATDGASEKARLYA
ncbi:hypothetical protein HK101_011272 [Irineochytrium annulatum]|nr:hypothetical protein HK101_011272 [Irineochytrium annulatum]